MIVNSQIVSLSELQENVVRDEMGKIFCLSGAFDLVHKGHISYILDCKKKAEEVSPKENSLVVIIDAAKHVIKKNGSEFASQKDRAFVISSIKGVDLVVLNDENEGDVIKALGVIKPDYFLKGGDRKDRDSIPEWDTCCKYEIEIIVGIGDGKVTGSANILARVGEWYEQFKNYCSINTLDPIDKLKDSSLVLAVNMIYRFRQKNNFGLGSPDYPEKEMEKDMKAIYEVMKYIEKENLYELIPLFFHSREERDMVHKILSMMGVIMPVWEYSEFEFI